MSHLQALDKCRRRSDEGTGWPGSATLSTLSCIKWRKALEHHPDRDFVDYISTGIDEGFRVGFQWTSRHVVPKGKNLPISNPEVVTGYLTREVSLNRMIKFSMSNVMAAHAGIQISPLGIIPKKNRPNKWRLITDLSSPEGGSVNDGIEREWSTLEYVSIDHLSHIISSVGRGAFLVKADIKEAYRIVPVHQDDQRLLGVSWNSHIYIDTRLPFGLRSAPKIFNAIADALQWVVQKRGVPLLIHYLDDYVLVAESQTLAVAHKGILVSTCKELDIPLEPQKLVGPSQVLEFLGIEVDTIKLQLRLPTEKLDRLMAILTETEGKKAISKRQLQSLVGTLQHACKVIYPGRAFLRRLHALLTVGAAPYHHIRLNVDARADITWWRVFAERWNGISMFWPVLKSSPTVTVVSDASGSWGCGAYWGVEWFQWQWPPSLVGFSIQVKELIPIIIAAVLYGRRWENHIVQFQVDNLAVVEVVSATYSRNSHLMHLTRLLVFLASRFSFWFTATHIPGRLNSLADALSRNNVQLFLSQVTEANPQQPVIPEELVTLITQDINWTSTHWMSLFSNITQLL